MVRLICDRKMKLGALLLLAGIPSKPMPESEARELIAQKREKLARLWLESGILRIVPDDGTAAVAAPAKRAAPARPLEPVDRVESAVRAVEHAETLIESLSDEERGRFEDFLAERHRRLVAAREETEGDDDATSGTEGGEGTNDRSAQPDTGAPPATLEGLTIPQAAPLIEAATDIELLQRWRDADARAGVHKLIDARLEGLTAPPPEG